MEGGRKGDWEEWREGGREGGKGEGRMKGKEGEGERGMRVPVQLAMGMLRADISSIP